MHIGRILILAGLAFVALGLVFVVLDRLNIPLGRLPGRCSLARAQHNRLFPGGYLHPAEPVRHLVAVVVQSPLMRVARRNYLTVPTRSGGQKIKTALP